MSYKTKVCQRCGKEYQPTSSTQKYCKECAYDADREQKARYYRANQEKRCKRARECYKANPEKEAKRYRANSENIREQKAKLYKANPEKFCTLSGNYRKANPDKVHQRDAKYQKAHPEVRALMNGKRYSLKYANTPTDELLTLVQWRDVLAQYNGHCAYCGKKVKLTLDHIIPLSRGGKHSKDNVVPACSHCNSSKGTKTPEERFGLGVAS